VDDLLAQLAQVRHFRGLRASELRSIIGRGKIHRLTAGAVLYEEGQPGAGLFVLLSAQREAVSDRQLATRNRQSATSN
jgi:CRP-like cAMP-binding protein